jgi:carboxymethylenebutenolidase
MGTWIDVKAADGGTFKAYLAVPAAGSGPGIMLCQEIFGVNQHMQDVANLWAEEGYVVICPDLFWRMEPGVQLGYDEEQFKKAFGFFKAFDVEKAIPDMADTIKALKARPELKGGVGALGFCLGGKLAYLAARDCGVDCSVSYYGVGLEGLLDKKPTVPMVLHFAGEDKFCPPPALEAIKSAFADRRDVEIYVYPGVDHAFNTPGRASYNKPASGMAHTRSLALFRKVLGPNYDLSALWEVHTALEFVHRDVDANMKTMVAEPYVNHVPVLTGGIGYKDLYRFYKHHFIPLTPKDIQMVPISRTIGVDRLVDEFIFSFTHDEEIDWLLPGVKPTGKFVKIPMMAVVNFRGDKLYHEHIYWDQATVLVQVGLLDPKGGLPIAGAETAEKVIDPSSVPSNQLMNRWKESANKG